MKTIFHASYIIPTFASSLLFLSIKSAIMKSIQMAFYELVYSRSLCVCWVNLYTCFSLHKKFWRDHATNMSNLCFYYTIWCLHAQAHVCAYPLSEPCAIYTLTPSAVKLLPAPTLSAREEQFSSLRWIKTLSVGGRGHGMMLPKQGVVCSSFYGGQWG